MYQSPAHIFLRIKKDKTYLLKLYVLEAVCTFLLILLCWGLHDLTIFKFELSHLLWLPLALVFGCLIASFIHNSSHGNVGNKWVNRMVGEFCGMWVLYGLTNFILVHLLHHQYSDKELDPVNPKGMNFLKFLSAPMRYMIDTAKKFLFIQHGHKKFYSQIMLVQTIVFHLNLVLRLMFWFVLFGPELFVVFYLPAFTANVAILAHINYVCHRDLPDGTIEIVNLNHNLYYKIANCITFGGYFHKNHHQRLSLFNPQKLKDSVLYVPRNFPHGPGWARYLDLNDIWGEREKNLRSGSKDDFHTSNRFQTEVSFGHR